MSEDLDDIVDNLSESSSWVRVLFMLGFLVGLYLILAPLVVVLTVVQALFAIFTAEPNRNLCRFGRALASYVQQILQFLTYNSQDKPFPFADFPSLDEEVAAEPEPESKPKSEAKPESEPEPEPEPKSESRPKSEAEPEPELEPELESLPEQAPEAELTSAQNQEAGEAYTQTQEEDAPQNPGPGAAAQGETTYRYVAEVDSSMNSALKL